MSAEKRKYKRFVVNLNIEFDLSPHQVEIESKSINISGGGICLETKEPLEKGKELLVKLFFQQGEKPLFVNGRVVWNRSMRVKNSEIFLNGIEFINMNEHDRSIIINFVDGATFQA